MWNERRRKERLSLELFLPVIDLHNNHLLGHIVDLSEEGFLLFSSEPIKLNQVFLLQINKNDLTIVSLCKNLTEELISFQAKSCWIDPTVQPLLNRTGFQFIDLNPETNKIILQITQNIQENLNQMRSEI